MSGWNLNPTQVAFLSLNNKHKVKLYLFLNQTENGKLKENSETLGASQYDPRQGRRLYEVLHLESCLYKGFCF